MNDNKFNLRRSGVNHINDLGFFTAQMPNRLEDSRRSGHSITSLLVPLAVKRNKLNPRYYFSQIFLTSKILIFNPFKCLSYLLR